MRPEAAVTAVSGQKGSEIAEVLADGRRAARAITPKHGPTLTGPHCCPAGRHPGGLTRRFTVRPHDRE